MLSSFMERIYHRYERWECYKAGFFYNITKSNKKELSEKVIELFTNPALTKKYMEQVIKQWPYSCEHNLTNTTMNRVAWLGQAACCLYGSVPNTVTMETWSKIDKQFRDKADKIAQEIISKYEYNQTHFPCIKFN